MHPGRGLHSSEEVIEIVLLLFDGAPFRMLLLVLSFVLQLQFKMLRGLILKSAGRSRRTGVGPGAGYSMIAGPMVLNRMRLIRIAVICRRVGVETRAIRVRIMTMIE